VKNEEELHRIEEERNIPQAIRVRRTVTGLDTYWVETVFRKYVIERKTEGRIEVRGRRGKRRRQLLDDLKKKIGDCKLKNETLDLTLCRKCFQRGYELVVRH